MPRPTPREVKAVAAILDPSMSEDAQDMAREAIEALDQVRLDKDQWILSARTMKDGPILNVGPWTTKNQAMKAAKRLAFVDPLDTPGVGLLVMPMRQPQWLDTLD